MANATIQSYLSDNSVDLVKRQKVLSALKSGQDEAKLADMITQKYGTKYGGTPTTPAVGQVLPTPKGALGVNRQKDPNAITYSTDITKPAEFMAGPAEAMKRFSAGSVGPASNVAGAGAFLAESLGKTAEAAKTGLLTGGEGVQKVGAAITGDTSQLEGYRSFYGLKKPEEYQEKQLTPAERGQMAGEGMQNFVSGAVGTAFAPMTGVAESTPIVREAMGWVGERIDQNSGVAVDLFEQGLKMRGIELSPEQKASMREGFTNVQNLFLLKAGEDLAKTKGMQAKGQKAQTEMRSGFAEEKAIAKGEKALAKGEMGPIEAYEQVAGQKGTLTSRMLSPVVEPLAGAAKTLAGGAGTALSAVAGKGVKAGMEALEKAKVERLAKATEKVDDTVAQIIQGKTKDLEAGKRALGQIETKGIKSYEDLSGALEAQISAVRNAQDALLYKSDTMYKLDNFTKEVVSGDTKIKYNPVREALQNLQEAYSKTHDIENLARITDLAQKAEKYSLSLKDLNDLAREYGTEFGKKAFGKTGEALTSVNARAYENTRTALKKAVRDELPDSASKAMDGAMHDMLNTKVKIDRMVEEVNKLKQKVQKRGLFEKLGRGVGAAIDMVTLGSFKGLVEKFLSRGTGLKTLNALDLEAILSKNLEKVGKWAEKVDTDPMGFAKELKAAEVEAKAVKPMKSATTTIIPDAAKMFPDEAALKTISDKAYLKTLKNGGVTISLKGGSPKKGYAYSPYKGLETVIEKKAFNPIHLDEFIKKNYNKLREKGNHLGVWEDKGKIYIDVSKVGKAAPETIAEAAKASQLSVYDLENFKTINTPYYEKANSVAINRGKVGGGDTAGSAGGAQKVSGGQQKTGGVTQSTGLPSQSKSQRSASSRVAGRLEPSGSTTKTSGFSKSTQKVLSSKRSIFLKNFDILGEAVTNKVLKEYYKATNENRPYFDNALVDIAKDVGGKGFYRVKTIDSLRLKLKRNEARGKKLGQIDDTLGGSILTDDIDGAIASARQRYNITNVDDFRPPEDTNVWGYRAVHMDIQLPNGQMGEIQIHTPEGIFQKEYAHLIYNKWRKQIESGRTNDLTEMVKRIPERRRMDFLSDVRKSNDIFNGEYEIPEAFKESVQKFIDKGMAGKLPKGAAPKMEARGVREYVADRALGETVLKKYLKKNGKIASADEAMKLYKDKGYKGYNSDEYHEVGRVIAEDAWRYNLKNNKEKSAALYAGASGSGKTTAINLIYPKIEEKMAAIYDGNLANLEKTKVKLQQIRDAGKKPKVIYIYRDLMGCFDGIINRMLTSATEKGRVISISTLLKNAQGSLDVIKELVNNAEKYGLKDSIALIDNSLGYKKTQKLTLDKLNKITYPKNARAQLVNIVNNLYNEGKITAAQRTALLK